MKRTPVIQVLLAATIVGIIAPESPTTGASAQTPMRTEERLLSPEARQFRLLGPEIYKVSRRSKDLIVDDFNGDGLLDILTSNNERGILEIYQQVRRPAEGQPRFERTEYALDRVVRSAVAMDVDGDGRMDFVFAASPGNLTIMYQNANGRLGSPVTTDIPAERILAADIDGRPGKELLVFAERSLIVVPSARRGLSLDQAQRVYTTGTPASDLMVLDFDGDGKMDIVYHDAGRFQDLVVRLQSAEGFFPTEFRVGSNLLRSVAPLAPAGSGKASVVAVQNNNRSLVQLELGAESGRKRRDGELELSTPHTIPFAPEARSRRFAVTPADINGNGRTDLLMVSPELSQMRLLLQTRDGSLREQMVPTLQGVETALIVPPARGRAAGIVLLSTEEKAVGFTTWDSSTETIPFPRILPIPGNPVGAAVWQEGSVRRLAVLLRGESAHELMGYTLSPDGTIGEGKPLVESSGLPGVGSRSRVTGIQSLDINRDGVVDLVLFQDFSPAVFLTGSKEGTFTPFTATSGVLEGLLSGTRPGLIKGATLAADNRTPTSVLVLKEKFARAMHIDKDQNVVVEEQFNSRDSSSRLLDMAVGSLRGRNSREVVLLDRAGRVLTIHGRDRNEPFTKLIDHPLDEIVYTNITLVDLDSDGRDDILLTADDRMTIIYTQPKGLNLNVVTSITTGVRDGGYGKVYGVQLPGNRSQGAIAVEMRENLLEFFELGRNRDGAPALNRYFHFKAFDSEATVARRVNMDAAPEPRELVVADLDEDGLPDLITLTHDNIIIYPGARAPRGRNN